MKLCQREHFCTNEQGAELVREELRTLFSLLHFSLWLGSKGEIHACEQYVKLIVNSLVSPVLWKTLYTASKKPLNLINLNGKDCEFVWGRKISSMLVLFE